METPPSVVAATAASPTTMPAIAPPAVMRAGGNSDARSEGKSCVTML